MFNYEPFTDEQQKRIEKLIAKKLDKMNSKEIQELNINEQELWKE